MAEKCIRAYHEAGEDTDILGSYTGVFRASDTAFASMFSPYSSARILEDSEPVQDADDL